MLQATFLKPFCRYCQIMVTTSDKSRVTLLKPFLYFQNTVTNADKLLAAADELAQTGECNPQEIYGEARLLEERMHAFLSRVQQRRNLLDMSVAFYTHSKEVSFLCVQARGIVTVRNSSFGNVMFSQACVQNSVYRRGEVYTPWAYTPRTPPAHTPLP